MTNYMKFRSRGQGEIRKSKGNLKDDILLQLYLQCISSILWQSHDYLMQHMIKSRIMQFRFWAAKYREKLQIRVNWKTIKKK